MYVCVYVYEPGQATGWHRGSRRTWSSRPSAATAVVDAIPIHSRPMNCGWLHVQGFVSLTLELVREDKYSDFTSAWLIANSILPRVAGGTDRKEASNSRKDRVREPAGMSLSLITFEKSHENDTQGHLKIETGFLSRVLTSLEQSSTVQGGVWACGCVCVSICRLCASIMFCQVQNRMHVSGVTG